MILNWTGDNMKIIPAHVPTELDPSTTSRFCVLAPGYNDVADDVWVEARTFVTDDIAKGKIVEEWTKTAKPDADKGEKAPLLWLEMEDARETKYIRVPATIRDIMRTTVLDKIKNTYLLPTLEKWSREENRPDVQAALVAQIDAVKKGQIAG